MYKIRGKLFVQILRAKKLHGELKKKKNKPDPFVRITIGESILAETKVFVCYTCHCVRIWCPVI